jgi:hypothetical protein
MPMVSFIMDRIYITRGREKTTRFCSGTKNIWTRFLDNIGDVPEMNDGDVKSRPLVNSAAVTNCFGRNSQPKVSDEHNSSYIAG